MDVGAQLTVSTRSVDNILTCWVCFRVHLPELFSVLAPLSDRFNDCHFIIHVEI